MQCFSVLWARRPSPEPVNVWYVNTDDNVIKTSDLNRIEGSYRSSMENLRTYSSEYNERAADERETVRRKAEKHQQYYRSLLPSHVNTSEGDAKVSRPDGFSYEEGLRGDYEKATLEDEEEDEGDRYRSRRIFRSPQEPKFNRVKMLKEKYMEMLDQNRDLNNLVPPTNTSGYSTAGSDDERDKHWCGNRGGRVERCASSDSAVGLTQSDDETVVTPEQCRINSGYQADNEYYSPYSPRGSIDHSNVPTKTIIEAQYVPFPIDRKYSDVSEADFEKNDSRRQSTFTDDYDEQPRSRYYRTPSVVVSDYSDDVIGLTLEDIEFFRNQRRERSSSPDSSLHSSCSNLNYVGSTISTLDAEYIMRQPFRKSSDCSTCSTGSGDENDCGDVPCNSKLLSPKMNTRKLKRMKRSSNTKGPKNN